MTGNFCVGEGRSRHEEAATGFASQGVQSQTNSGPARTVATLQLASQEDVPVPSNCEVLSQASFHKKVLHWRYCFVCWFRDGVRSLTQMEEYPRNIVGQCWLPGSHQHVFNQLFSRMNVYIPASKFHDHSG